MNSRDAVAIAGQFTPDAVQADPVTNPPNVGRDAIAAFFEAGIGASDDWRFAAKRVHTCGQPRRHRLRRSRSRPAAGR